MGYKSIEDKRNYMREYVHRPGMHARLRKREILRRARLRGHLPSKHSITKYGMTEEDLAELIASVLSRPLESLDQ